MQKKEDKVGNETVYKEGRQRNKIQRARLRKIVIDPQKSSNFDLWASAKNMFNYIPLVGNIPSVLQTSLLAILMKVKNQFKKGNGENIFFSFLAGLHQSVN